MDLQEQKNIGVHVPYSIFCLYCGGPMGRFNNMQDSEKFPFPTGHEELHDELWSVL